MAARFEKGTRRLPLAVTLCGLLAAACTGPSAGADAGSQEVADDGSGLDPGADTATEDAVGVDAVGRADGADGGSEPDAEDAGTDASCPGGIGCPCDQPTECDVPICLATNDGRRCSTYCGDGDCPTGWSCAGTTGAGDTTFFCIPQGGLLCQPCNDHEACRAGGHVDAACVSYGDDGAFCGVACSDDTSCPAGSVCRDVLAFDGAPTRQCVRPGDGPGNLGVCACSPAAAASALGTTCWLSSGSGAAAKRCKGGRVCGGAGLGPCVALTGAQASCLETQCIDPITKLPKPNGAACDDGRACTVADGCVAGLCASGQQTCPCEPFHLECPAATGATNLCKGPSYCAPTPGAELPYACLPNPGQTKLCDTSLDGACSKNACAPLTGVCAVVPVETTVEICDLPPAAGATTPGCRREVIAAGQPPQPAPACDDGLSCSTGDACAAGTCKPKELAACQCQQDSDCSDDGDLCNGLPFCDKAGTTWSCKVNPATVISCADTGDPCTKHNCQPIDGSCKKAPAVAATACDDGVACTTGDSCDGAGACMPGTWTCCKSDADCQDEEDGNLCNGTLFCNKQSGACEPNPATAINCPSVDDTACRKNTCQPKIGTCELVPTAKGKACDDDNACTGGDSCDGAGGCLPGAEICVCKSDADCLAKDDGDLCNGTLYCHPVANADGTNVCKLNPKTLVTCPSVDDSACQKNVCQAKTGTCAMVASAAATGCDADGTACTNPDACDGKGACVAGEAVCACQADADCKGKEDGDLCNGVLYCDKSGPAPACKLNPATLVTCPSVDDTACAQSLCAAAKGTCAMTKLAAGTPCSDGDACTGGDACDGKGTCAAGANACTCKIDGDCKTFDDGDLCNGAPTCKAGICAFAGQVAPDCDDGDACTVDGCAKQAGCTHTAAKACNDGNPCTQDSCDKQKGCVVAPATGPCDDGDACTAKDTCGGGTCQAGAATDCADGNVCTADSCDKQQGCANTAAPGSCSDGSACTEGDACAGGVCKGGGAKSCDDGKPCTDDACTAQQGCVVTANTAPCEDGNPCTTNDACSGGTCKGGAAKVCDDGDPCTADACSTGKGCGAVPAGDGPCDDGDPCTVGEQCSAGACKGGGAKSCDDGSVCTTDSCDKQQGCLHAYNTGFCDDKDLCTVGEACNGGACKGGSKQACDDGKACTDDACEAGKGCVATLSQGPCDDGDACTEGDTCNGGTCDPGAAKTCDDGKPCTTDGCDQGVGCVFGNNSASCDDGDACTTNDACSGGACKGGAAKACDDGVACTTDSCAASTGCQHVAAKDGTPCGTGGSCVGGACTLGGCGSGTTAMTIDDGGVAKTACGAIGPIWGNRPVSPQGVYSIEQPGGTAVIVDAQTKLMWQRTLSGTKVSVLDALSYCDGLDSAGAKDWRVPTLHELLSLVDFSVSTAPLIDTTHFPSTSLGAFWTSTKIANGGGNRFTVDFELGEVFQGASSGYVRCVRGGMSGAAAAQRFLISTGGLTVVDKFTGLMWERQVSAKATMADAKSNCGAKSLEGNNGYGLPTIRELLDIVDVTVLNPATDSGAFPQTPKELLWSATMKAGSSTYAWEVHFAEGFSGKYSAYAPSAYRCVRK